jgi:hypothetical protein
MSGFCGYMNIYRACCAFLEAGGDCLLFMRDTEEYITEMKKCIREGELSLETLKLRAYRMLCFAKDYFEKNPSERFYVDENLHTEISSIDNGWLVR